MKISRIDHLGIAVQSIDDALPYFENTLGLKCYAIEEVAADIDCDGYVVAADVTYIKNFSSGKINKLTDDVLALKDQEE